MEGHTDGIEEYLINPRDPFIYWVVSELSGTNGEESTDSA